jgi:hypothetical protein
MPPTFTDEGARAAREIKQAHPEIGVLVLSQHIDTTHAMSLVTLGGFGYLLKDRVLAVQDFLAAAQRVADGGSALDPQVVGALMTPRPSDDPLSALSDREREVLELMAQGLNNPAIARRLVASARSRDTSATCSSSSTSPSPTTATAASSPSSPTSAHPTVAAPDRSCPETIRKTTVPRRVRGRVALTRRDRPHLGHVVA